MSLVFRRRSLRRVYLLYQVKSTRILWRRRSHRISPTDFLQRFYSPLVRYGRGDVQRLLSWGGLRSIFDIKSRRDARHWSWWPRVTSGAVYMNTRSMKMWVLFVSEFSMITGRFLSSVSLPLITPWVSSFKILCNLCRIISPSPDFWTPSRVMPVRILGLTQLYALTLDMGGNGGSMAPPAQLFLDSKHAPYLPCVM